MQEKTAIELVLVHQAPLEDGGALAQGGYTGSFVVADREAEAYGGEETVGPGLGAVFQVHVAQPDGSVLQTTRPVVRAQIGEGGDERRLVREAGLYEQAVTRGGNVAVLRYARATEVGIVALDAVGRG